MSDEFKQHEYRELRRLVHAQEQEAARAELKNATFRELIREVIRRIKRRLGRK